MAQYVGIEGGGTKFVCAYGSGPHDIHDRIVIHTETADATMRQVIAYIRSVQAKVQLSAIGASVFGPLDLDKESATYGYITTTPKPGWGNFDFVGTLQKTFHLPIGFDTDVNAAAISEYRWGAAQGISDLIYLTIGTGIGGGVIANHQLIHGAMHPEMGHILIPIDKDDSFHGVCPYHKNCLEGLASGPSLQKRWGVASALELPENHAAWDLEASYLGLALVNFTLCLAPKRIILGGGVMRKKFLLPKIRKQFLHHLKGYVKNPTVTQNIESYIVLPGLEENAGVCGAIALAELASQKE